MGFLKKLFGTAAVTGAAVGGALYVKKRKEEKDIDEDIFEDFDDSKAFDVATDDNGDSTKVIITINKRKVKNFADSAADKIIDTSEKIKDTVSEKLGEDNVNIIKDKASQVKEKAYEAADIASEKAKDFREMAVSKVGEDKIDATKEKISNVATKVTDTINNTIDKMTSTSSSHLNDIDDNLFDEDDLEDAFTDQDVTEDDFVTEDDVTVDSKEQGDLYE